MKKGDKLICIKSVNNLLEQPLFEKGKEYEVLHVDNEKVKVYVVLNHNLYGNEYNEWEIEWVYKHFKFK